jgi:hypothetical protein
MVRLSHYSTRFSSGNARFQAQEKGQPITSICTFPVVFLFGWFCYYISLGSPFKRLKNMVSVAIAMQPAPSPKKHDGVRNERQREDRERLGPAPWNMAPPCPGCGNTQRYRRGKKGHERMGLFGFEGQTGVQKDAGG